MSKLIYIVLVFSVLVRPALAADSKPSEQSIKQLLAVTETRKLLDGMMNQIDGMMENSMRQALQGKPLAPEQQKAFDNMRAKSVALLKQELSWDSLEPFYIRMYRDSFTQEEINGMLAFYKTPSGQAVIKKMPAVMQGAMVEMQKRMGTLMPKLQQIQKETLAELKSEPAK